VGRHGRRAAVVAALCALTTALSAQSALAAAEIGDAGELPLTAQEPGPSGPLLSITGAVGTFDSDMYKVCLTGGADFSASTVGPTGFDTQLFLFDEQGMAVYANDDDPRWRPQSTLPANHTLGPKTRGVYYLAISAFDRDPQSGSAFIFGSSSGVLGPGRGANVITGWANRDMKPGGTYAITLTGTRSCVDDTPPTVTLTTPSDGATYGRNDVVTAKYECADESDGSGLDSCVGDVPVGDAIDTSTLGTHEFRVTARDRRGNERTVTHTYTVEDRTAPTVLLTTPPDGTSYQRGETPPRAVYECFDEPGGSGIASCVGDVPAGEQIDTSTVGEHTFTVTATDAAGNEREVTHNYVVLDGTAPTVDLRTPGANAVYGQGDVVTADYDCADEDGGSGLASCLGDVPDGARIDTATVGDHTFTVRAVDAAGNASSRSVTYRVEERFAFDFEGFFWPVRNRPRVNVVRAGWLVPIRFSLDGWQGRDVIADGYPRSREIRCGSTADLDGGERTRAAGRWRLRYRPRRDLYVYLWKTDRDWAGECRQFILKLADGSYHRADFRFLRKRRHWHDIWHG
jgi:hypothetical protein